MDKNALFGHQPYDTKPCPPSEGKETHSGRTTRPDGTHAAEAARFIFTKP
jgi:hypothetical protein